MKTLHVHIGTHKTATTSIQCFCEENGAALEKDGYCYPSMPFSYPGILRARNGHFLIGKVEDKDKEAAKKEEERRFCEGMKRVNECFQQFDHVVLSDENIWLSMDCSRPELWKDLKKEADKNGFSIHVIVYLRRQDKYIQSVWNQRIKGKIRLSESLEGFLEIIQIPMWLDYYQKLERVAEIIGKENITVRRFEPKNFKGGNIYEDFLQTIGLSLTDKYKVSVSVRNEGLYGNDIEIKRVLNELPSMQNDDKAQTFIKDRLVECSKLSAEDYPCAVMSKEETVAFLDRFRLDNRKILEEYLHEQGGELFDESIEDLPKWEKDNPYMTDDVIRFVGAMGIYLYKENQKLQKQIRELNALRHPFKTFKKFLKHKFGRKK